MNVGKLFSLGARFEHAVIVMSFTMFIINCLRWISKRVHKHLRKDKEDDREEENGGDFEDDSADDDESESDHHNGESESDCQDDDESEIDCQDDDESESDCQDDDESEIDCQDDDESESDCEDEDDECDCDGGNAEYWSNIVSWLDFVKRNPLNIITRMTTIRGIEPGVEVQNEVQVVPTGKATPATFDDDTSSVDKFKENMEIAGRTPKESS
uniref:uncharacterized protein isoform X2 n=1 Tax=Myxine glutinosa TaxID=7769 RepID=UPI00358E0336